MVPRLPSAPLLSSAQTGWNGIQLERHRLQPVHELAGVIDGYQICLHLTDPVLMTWRIEGRDSSRIMRQRELCTATHGEFRTVSWNGSFETLLFSISPKIMHRISAENGRGRAVELVKHRGIRDLQIETILRLLHTDVAAGSPAGSLFGEQLGTALALYLCQRFAVDQHQARQYRSGLPGSSLRRVFEYIEAHLERPISLEQLAGVAQMSRFYFSVLFRNSTGESPCRYVIGRRIERAKQMLEQGCGDLVKITQATGFSSQSHLTSVFRGRMGLTPAKYRSHRR